MGLARGGLESSVGSGGDTTTVTEANGLTSTLGDIALAAAGAASAGAVTTGTQTLAGAKTFSSAVTLGVGLNADGTDSSGTPGAATIHKSSGQSSFAALASSCVITNSTVATTSKVFAALQTIDGTLTSILTVVPGTGSFTVTGNATATGTTKFCWFVIN